jgi:translocation and assembly module TamB
VRTGLQLLWPLVCMLLLLALLLAVLATCVGWLVRSEDGTRWLLRQLPMVQARGVQGALLGQDFAVQHLRITWNSGQAAVVVQQARLQGLAWRWRPSATAWVGLSASQATAAEVTVDSGPSSDKPLSLPTSLALPLHVQVDALQVARLRVNALPWFEDIRGQVALGPGDQHRASGVSLLWDRLRIEGGAQIAETTPFALSANLRLQPRHAPSQPQADFNAALRLQGALNNIEAVADVRGVDARLPKARDGRSPPAPSAELQATLAPFAPWPLVKLSGRTQALDLGVFASAAPQTRLSGEVQVFTSGRTAPIQAQLRFDNPDAGRWNERRLPLRTLKLAVQTDPQQRDRVLLQTLALTLSDGGRWEGQGEWLGHALRLQTRLTGLRPQLADGRAPAMQLSGPLDFTLQGLPNPRGQAAPQPPAIQPMAPAAGPRPAAPATTAQSPASAPAASAAVASWPWALELDTTLQGQLEASPRPVTLQLQASLNGDRLELRQLRARAGDAVAEGTARAERGANGGWQLRSEGLLQGVDPALWWPGDAGSAWRRGPHRLNANWHVDLRLPANARQLAPLALAQRIAGNGSLKIQDALLAGVPLALDLRLLQSARPSGAPDSLEGELHLGGNRLQLNAHGEPLGEGLDDQIELQLQAPRLAELAPVLRLLPALQPYTPLSGQAKATLNARGRWPQLRTEGQAEVLQWQSTQLALAHGQASWRLDSGGQAQQPLELQAELRSARLGQQKLERARADLRGTWRAHQLDLQAAFALTPPPWAESALDVRAGVGTLAHFQGSGGWEPSSGGAGVWRGQVDRVSLGGWDGQALLTAPVAAATNTPTPQAAAARNRPWLDARGLRAQLDFGPGGHLQKAQAAPGQVRLADTATLRWDEVLLDLSGPRADLELNAEITPFLAPPLLARLQPDMGWGGDLRLAAKVQVKAAESFDADIVFQRHDGDLTLRDDVGLQLLGLSDLRVSVQAHEGQWFFTHGLAGRTLGEMSGALRVVTTPQARWPGKDDPLDGVVQAHVANLGVWGTWVPPGWRLGGEVNVSATVGGRFGAPEYTGGLTGQNLAVRNVLQGVNINQGEVAIQLNGLTASIEKFNFKAGEGTAQITGGAEFGDAQRVNLKLVADKLRLLGRIDRQLIVSGQTDVLLTRDLVQVQGKLNVDEGLFDTSKGNAPGLDDDVTVQRQTPEEQRNETPVAPRKRGDLQVAVDVDLGEKLRVKGRGLDTGLRGQLRVTTPGGRLQVQGAVNTVDGTYAAYGQKLTIDRGILAFSGPYDNPRLDILALRANTDTRVGVAITGNVLTPRVRLYSETDMSETDKLSWLVMGRAADGLGRTDTALLQRAAVALLSGEGEAPTDQVLKSLGIDELSLRQSDGDVRETVISLGKQLSRRWYVGYERSVNATAGTWQLVYRIAQRFTLRAQSGLENSLDVIWVWKVDDALAIPGVTKSAPKPP